MIIVTIEEISTKAPTAITMIIVVDNGLEELEAVSVVLFVELLLDSILLVVMLEKVEGVLLSGLVLEDIKSSRRLEEDSSKRRKREILISKFSFIVIF